MDAKLQRWKKNIRPGHIVVAALLLVALPLSVYISSQTTNTQQHADSPANAVVPTDTASQTLSQTLTPTPRNPTPTKNIEFLP